MSSDMTTYPLDASKFIARKRLNAGRLTLLKMRRLNRIPINTVAKIINVVRQNPPQPCSTKRFENKTSSNRIGTVVVMKRKLSETGGFRIFSSIAPQPLWCFSQGLKNSRSSCMDADMTMPCSWLILAYCWPLTSMFSSVIASSLYRASV